MPKLLIVLLLLLFWPAGMDAKSRARTAPRAASIRKSRVKCQGCPRASNGRIRRSSAARTSFRKRNPCPSTGKTTGACPGYVIDHLRPLKRGGADTPSNMQWQTKAAAKAKDRIE